MIFFYTYSFSFFYKGNNCFKIIVSFPISINKIFSIAPSIRLT